MLAVIWADEIKVIPATRDGSHNGNHSRAPRPQPTKVTQTADAQRLVLHRYAFLDGRDALASDTAERSRADPLFRGVLASNSSDSLKSHDLTAAASGG
jgi:hypothetical protein